jgi:hypothetical protein
MHTNPPVLASSPPTRFVYSSPAALHDTSDRYPGTDVIVPPYTVFNNRISTHTVSLLPIDNDQIPYVSNPDQIVVETGGADHDRSHAAYAIDSIAAIDERTPIWFR